MKLFSDKNKPLLIAFWLLAFAFAAVLVLRIILVFSYIAETGGVSVNVLFSIVRMINGYPLYADPQLPPYPIAQYMPLHYYLVTLCGKLFGIQNNVHAISVLNRFFCLAFDLLVFIPVYKILSNVFNITGKKLITAVYMCIFLVLPNQNYSRIDNLYLLMFACTVYFFLQFVTQPGNTRRLVYAGVAVSLALFTKQSGLFLLAATGLYLLIIHKDWNATFKFSLTVIASCFILFMIFINHHYYEFYQNSVLGLKNGIVLNWFYVVIVKAFFYKMYFFVACGLALSLLVIINPKDARLKFLGFISIIIFLFSFAASFKMGSSLNYFTEFLALTFIIAAVYFSNTESSHYFTAPSLFSFVILFILPFFILAVYNDKGWGHLSSLKRSEKTYRQMLRIKEYLEPKLNKDDLVFTEFHKENLLNIILSDHSIFPQREIVMLCTYPKKIFSYDDFAQKISSGKIKYWIGKAGGKPADFLNQPFNHFEPDTVMGGFALYRYQSF